MSKQLISHNADLKRLRDEGFDVSIRDDHLVVASVPYVDSTRAVRLGTLVSGLDLEGGDRTRAPQDHVARFQGAEPCDHTGAPLATLINERNQAVLTPGITVDFSFSHKPAGGYRDYHHKMTSYAKVLWSHAQVIDPNCTPMCFPVIADEDDSSVFNYVDTATSRAGIGVHTAKLDAGKVAIVGLGGTGGYLLDFLAKTPVPEIHLYDGDVYLQHNAFRSPGAATVEGMQGAPLKVDYFAGLYSHMRRGIIPHAYRIDAGNVGELDEMSYVFIAVDDGEARMMIAKHLEERGVPFTDVGMGVSERSGGLGGMVRVTTSAPTLSTAIEARKRLSASARAGGDRNVYSNNIQVVELNALNAAFAIVRWKRHLGFYEDVDHQHNATFVIGANELINEDHP